jgi:hypothetical protein
MLVTNGDGSRTLTVWGGTDPVTNPGWQWTTHNTDCNTDRAGAGFAIGWNDPTDPGNPLTGKTSSGQNLTIGLGTATDNVVHPTPQQVSGKPAAHDVSNPSQYASWLGGCGVYVNHPNPVTLPNGKTQSGSWSQGVWGPISHTYPASVKGPVSVCPIMYDVHGKQSGTAPNGAKEITAGGDNHNGDNSLQSNGTTPQGNGCFATVFGTPHLSIVKDVSADGGQTWQDQVTVPAGTQVQYRFTVTNDGDQGTDLSDVHVVDDTGACDGSSLHVVSPAGFDGHLAVGQQAIFECSHTMGSSDLVNVAHAEGAYTPSGGPPQTVDSPQDTATVHVTPASQAVLGERVASGSARLAGPTGCVARTFSARVRGTKIARVVFVLDGKVIRTLKKPTRGVYGIRINPAHMRVGVHRLQAKITFLASSRTHSRTLKLSFQRCGKRLIAPRFTG